MTHQHRGRRVAALTAVLAMVATLFSLVAAAPASAAGPGNPPAQWTFVTQTGFQIFAGKGGASQTPVQPPECSDGINNDVAVDSTVAVPVAPQDTLIDYPADPQCFSVNDNSESFQGVGSPIVPVDQPKAISAFKANIAADGTMSAFVLSFPTQYSYSSKGCVRISQSLNATGNSGTFNAATNQATVNLNLNVNVLVNLGCGSSGVSCAINPLPVSLSTSVANAAGPPAVTPAAYDQNTGMSTLADNTFAIPAAVGFGCAGLNTAFGLPAASGASALQVQAKVFPATDTAPVSNAGSAQVVTQGSTVTLHGSGTDADTVLCLTLPCPTPGPNWFKWTQTGGTAVTLSDPFAAQPTFTAPAASVTPLTFSLVTADGGAVGYNGPAATTSVTVNAPVNQAPIANAGPPQTVASAASPVTLDGSGSSDPDSGPGSLTYAWSQTAGPAVTLSSTTAQKPTFTAPAGPTSLTFSLTVNDGAANSASPSTVVITVSAPANVAPVANAGPPQTVNERTGVTLDGSGSSDPDSGPGPLTYLWTQTAGPAVTLSSTTAQKPTFVAPRMDCPGSQAFTFSLTVNDGAVSSSPSTVTITENAVNGLFKVGNDFNGDGKSDVVEYASVNGNWNIRCRGVVHYGSTAGGDVAVQGDYTGDGITDLSVFSPVGANPDASRGGKWWVWGQPTVQWPALAGDIPVPADYNGDGIVDEALYRPSTNAWLLSPGGSWITFGGPGAIPVPGDYTGDGVADLSFYVPAWSAWYVANGSNVASPTVTRFGGPNFIPTPGTFDGGTTLKLAVFKTTTGQFYRYGIDLPVTSGGVGDIPAIGAFNGDGKAYFGRYRPAAKAYFIHEGPGALPSYSVVWNRAGFAPVDEPYSIYRLF